MSTFREEMQAKAAAQAKVIGDKNLKEGNAFLAENKKKRGW